MILGIIIEEALIGLMMESPSSKHIPEKSIWASWMNNMEYIPTENAPEINSLSDLREWISKKVPDAAKVVWNEGKIKWEKGAMACFLRGRRLLRAAQGSLPLGAGRSLLRHGVICVLGHR